jgi:S1-C subfamily serine protease
MLAATPRQEQPATAMTRFAQIIGALLLAGAAACIRQEVPPQTPQTPAPIADESVVPGTIGVVVRGGDAGVVIAGIGKQSSADAAGVRIGDVVQRYNGIAVASPTHFYRLMLDSPPGGTVVLEVLRDGMPRRFEIRVREIDTDWRASLRDKRYLSVAPACWKTS